MMFLARRHPWYRPLSSALRRCPTHASGQAGLRDACDPSKAIRNCAATSRLFAHGTFGLRHSRVQNVDSNFNEVKRLHMAAMRESGRLARLEQPGLLFL